MPAKDTVTLPVDLIKGLGKVLDDVCSYVECNCPGGDCTGDCLHSMVSYYQDKIVDILKYNSEGYL